MAIGFGGFRTVGTPAGAGPRDYDPAYGGIPNLPPYVEDTSTAVGTDVQAEMIRNLPNYLAMSQADVGNIGANLAGRISPDVLALIQQQAAERGVMTGAPGSPNTDAAYLRALGLTSLQLQQLGHQQLTEAMKRTPVQQKQTTTTRRDLGEERAVYAAAPSPAAAARQAMEDAKAGIAAGQGGAGYGGGFRAPTTVSGGGGGLPWWMRPENQSNNDWNYNRGVVDAKSTGGATIIGGVPTYGDYDAAAMDRRWRETYLPPGGYGGQQVVQGSMTGIPEGSFPMSTEAGNEMWTMPDYFE